MEVTNEVVELLNMPEYRVVGDLTKRLLIKDHIITSILDYIYHHPKYRKLVFYGGTCAEVVYGLPRLSEDIDLENSVGVDITDFGKELEKHLITKFKLADLHVYVQKGEGGIHRATVRVPKLLYATKLAPTEREKLHIKVEMSNHTQVFNRAVSSVMRDGRLMTIAHFDKESLMAGKMIACMERVFRKGVTKELVKGRDWFDLWWYMNQGVVPNEEKLRADSEGQIGSKEAWKIIKARIAKLKRRDLEMDLVPFFTDQVFINDWLDNFHDFFARVRPK